MFGKKKRMIDKVIMGAVIGGAIGSVIGAVVAPEKGKKTREGLFTKIKNLIKKFKKKENISTGAVHEMKKIPNETFKDPKEANK